MGAHETVDNDNLKHNLLLGTNHLLKAHRELINAADTINKKDDAISNLTKHNELQIKDNQLIVQKLMSEKNLHKIDNAKEYYQRQHLWANVHGLQHQLYDKVKDLDAEKAEYAKEKAESTKEIDILKDNLAKEKAI